MDDLKSKLSDLYAETQSLTQDALEESGDADARAARARELDEQLRALRAELDQVESDQAELERIWEAAERDVIFLLFEAGESQEEPAQGEVTAEDVTARAMAISADAFDLAKAVIHKQIGQEERQKRVQELDQRLVDLAGLPGQDSPEVQEALSEADLDLNFAYEGGSGPMSLRVHHYLEGLK